MSDTTIDFDPFRSGEIARTVPSTEPQREIISSALLGTEANVAFNEAVSLRFAVAPTAQAVSDALAVIVARHDSLRATFTRTGDELLISNESTFTLEQQDETALESTAVESRLRAVWREMVCTPMNLFDGPLFRARLIGLPDQQAELVLLAHHIVCDGWSFYILLEELVALLNGETLANEPRSFADFAEQQHAGQVANADIDYWLNVYAKSVPEIDLPTDRPRPAERSFTAQRTDYAFDRQTVAAIKALSRECRASVVQVTFAAIAVLLKNLSGSNDIAIGLPVARQSTDGLDDLLGHAVQLLPIRLQLDDGGAFKALVADVKARILDAQEHPNFTFGSLVRELGYSGDPSRVPIVPVIFNIDQPFGDMSVDGQPLQIRSVPRVAENFEVFLNVMPSADGLLMEATHNTDLFDADTMFDWMAAVKQILMAAAAQPDLPLNTIWQSGEPSSAGGVISGPDSPLSAQRWLDQFGVRVAQTPDKHAVVDANGSLTYAQLDRRSNALATSLLAAGVAHGDVIAHCMDRNAEVLVAMLGIQKCGAVMLPLDPRFPEERLTFMLRDAGVQRVVVSGAVPVPLQQADVAMFDLGSLERQTDVPAAVTAAAHDNAYLIYTSGSTGVPKGVLVGHQALDNFLASMQHCPGFTADDRLLAVTTTSFDISMLELLLPLYCGGTVYVATRDEAADATALKALIEDQSISVLQATPATWRLLVASRWEGATALKALCGGEALPADLATSLLPLVDALWNMYGPTESTIWSSCKRIEPGFESITVGRPIHNTSFVLLDATGSPVPSGIPGELCIGGAGLAAGYLDRDALTRERFIDTERFGRLYRTGDKARFLRNGDVQFLGRFDDQVKVRGFRIELGDIESALNEHPDIEQAAAHIWSLSPTDQRIVVCCVVAADASLVPFKLRKFLRNKLPDYMLPQHFMQIEEIPLGTSGKVNRKALPTPVAVESKIGSHAPPANAAQKAIANIWQTLVKPDRPIGRDDRFFEIGGHSLLGLEAIFQIEQRLNVTLHPRLLYTATLQEIAAHCSDDAATQSDAQARPARLSDEDATALSFAQHEVALAYLDERQATTYHLPACFKLIGRLDAELLERSLQAVFAANDALTTLVERRGDTLFPVFAGVDAVPPLEQIAIGVADTDALQAQIAQFVSAPMNLLQGPLARTVLMRCSDTEHYLVFVPHQIAFDGWSFDIFLKQLSIAYAHDGTLPQADEDSVRYRDYAAWQRAQTIDAETAEYWRAQASALQPLPAWSVEDAAQASGIACVTLPVPADQLERIEAYSQAQDVSLANIMLGVFIACLGRAADTDRIAVDLATSGRYLPELFSQIGLFYQDLPVSIPVTEALPETISHAAAAVRELAQHQNASRAQIASLLDAPLLRPGVAFSFQQATERPDQFGALGLQQVEVARQQIAHDLEFWMRRTADGLVAQIDYRSDTVAAAGVSALAEDMLAAVAAIASPADWTVGDGAKGLFATGSTKPAGRRGLLSRLLS